MDKSNIKLISFNCKSVKTSMDCVRGFCRDADIIALQETWLLPHDIPLLGEIDEEFSATGKSAVDTGKELLIGRPYGGVALLWRRAVFPNVTVIQCDNDRVCAVRVFVNEWSFLVINVYMPTDTTKNLPIFTDCMSAISAIVESAEVDCVYVLGDFNANIGQPFGKELLTFCAEQKWFCADFEKLGHDSDCYTFVSDAHGTQSWLDHCLVTESAWKSIVDVYVTYDTYPSDHFPLYIICNLDIVRTKFNSVIKPRNNVLWGDRDVSQIDIYNEICQKELCNINLPSECEKCYNNMCKDIGHKILIDKLYNDTITVLSQAAIKSKNSNNVKRKTVKKPTVTGWNKHVRDAHGQARQDFELWSQYGRPKTGVYYDKMCLSKRIFKAKLAWCLKHKEQIKMDILATSHSNKRFDKFWKDVGKLNIKPRLPVSVEGVSEPKAIANLFKDHFRVPPQPVESRKTANTRQTLSHHPPLLITAKEVAKIIANMSRGKSPGHDGLSKEHFKYAGVHLPRILAILFNLCIGHSYFPPDFMKTLVVPIIKNKTGDASDKCNYRPISLATITAKVFDGVLDRQLDIHMNLHDAQFGFRAGLSTESAILALKHTVRYYTDRSTPVYACFLDLSKAFDLVSYEILWDKLEKSNLPSELICIFRHWYDNQVNIVRWAGEQSDEYRLDCGVRQGGLTSPKLFNLYMDQLIRELSSMHAGCSIDGVNVNNISYADDMVLLSPSISALRKLLQVCEAYADTHGLKYNIKKSELMVFAAGSSSPNVVPPVKLYGNALTRVKRPYMKLRWAKVGN
ncbi:hypothetical protein O0L34_g11585 [Tuta absoluta]|nr:hypothetical protein O0L34_g11585 [Tuta absoluta]